MKNIAPAIFCPALAVVRGRAGGAARESMNRAAAAEFGQGGGPGTVGDPEAAKADGNPAAGRAVPGTGREDRPACSRERPGARTESGGSPTPWPSSNSPPPATRRRSSRSRAAA
jgi:hypothetical protein